MILDGLGFLVGVAVAPLVALRSLLTGARAFHPEGVVCRAEAVALGDGELARRLAGPALVRLSPALRRDDGADVLGVGIRFRARPRVTAHPDHGDQDLLLATFDSFRPSRLKEAIRQTDAHDYLANDYRAVARYRVGDLGPARLRAVGSRPAAPGGTRLERLTAAMARGAAALRLDADGGDGWTPLVEIRLHELVPLNQAMLRFSPRRAGRGIRPLGFLNGIRAVVYPVSQAARAWRCEAPQP